MNLTNLFQKLKDLLLFVFGLNGVHLAVFAFAVGNKGIGPRVFVRDRCGGVGVIRITGLVDDFNIVHDPFASRLDLGKGGEGRGQTQDQRGDNQEFPHGYFPAAALTTSA